MLQHRLPVVVVLALFVGCGSDDGSPEESFDVAVEESAPLTDPGTVVQTPDLPHTAALTADDVDRWRRGMAGELEAVAEAEAGLASAATADDTLNAMMAATEMSTRSAGARAAGVSEDRYQFIRGRLSSAVGYLSPLEQEMDVSQMTPEMVAQFEDARIANLERMSDVIPADLVEVLRSQATQLRQQDMALTAARMRVAEAAR